jgi:hypothetical protein
MSVSILSRTISALADKRIVLANDQIGRIMGIGSTWSQLNIGIRWAINPNGFTSTTSQFAFRFGVCSGTAAMIGNATTTNFVGISPGTNTPTGALTWGASPASFSITNWASPIRRVGTTWNYGSLDGFVGYITADPANKRSAVVLQITKGSPNYNLDLIFPSSAAAASVDISQAGLIAAVEAATGAGSQSVFTSLGASYSDRTQASSACSEVAGAFNAINIQWGLSSRPLEISDIIYARIL